MRKDSNKALDLLRISLLVSLIIALAVNIGHSFNNGFSITEFISSTYLTFINKLVMPIGVTLLVYYIIIPDRHENRTLFSRVREFMILAGISLIFVVGWNVLDLIFMYTEFFNLEGALHSASDELMAGLLLCVPIAFLVKFVFAFPHKD